MAGKEKFATRFVVLFWMEKIATIYGPDFVGVKMAGLSASGVFEEVPELFWNAYNNKMKSKLLLSVGAQLCCMIYYVVK